MGIFSNPFSLNPQTQYYQSPSGGNVWSYSPAPFYKQPGFWGGVGGSFTPLGSLGGKLAGTIFGKATGVGQGTWADIGPIKMPGMPSTVPYSAGGWDFQQGTGGWINGSLLGGFNVPAPSASGANYTGDPLSLIVSQTPLTPGTYPTPNYTGGPIGGSELEQSIMQGLGPMEFTNGSSSNDSVSANPYHWGAQQFVWGDVEGAPRTDVNWMEQKATNIVHKNVSE